MGRLFTRGHLLHGESSLRDILTGRFACIVYMLSLKILHPFLDRDGGRSGEDRRDMRFG